MSKENLSQAGPVCQWILNRAYLFHHIAGDSVGLFHRPPAIVLHRHISSVDDAKGTWAARLDRIFSGQIPLDRWTTPVSDGGYVLVQIPVHAGDGAVRYAAGFAFPSGQRLPAPRSLNFAARAVLGAIQADRARTAAFLHDTIAQYLSSAGLQLDLLRLEIEARKIAIPARAAEIQGSLDEALQQVRNFSSKME
jgi:signal transduction histidine kinase